jgi:hypothetical protein
MAKQIFYTWLLVWSDYYVSSSVGGPRLFKTYAECRKSLLDDLRDGWFKNLSETEWKAKSGAISAQLEINSTYELHEADCKYVYHVLRYTYQPKSKTKKGK